MPGVGGTYIGHACALQPVNGYAVYFPLSQRGGNTDAGAPEYPAAHVAVQIVPCGTLAALHVVIVYAGGCEYGAHAHSEHPLNPGPIHEPNEHVFDPVIVPQYPGAAPSFGAHFAMHIVLCSDPPGHP
jgi:hypothetical protein